MVRARRVTYPGTPQRHALQRAALYRHMLDVRRGCARLSSSLDIALGGA